MDLVHCLRDELLEIRAKSIPILGVCNGFQILVEAGLLPGEAKIGKPTAVLDINLSTRFEYWVNRPLYFPDDSRVLCIWTMGVAGACFTLPVAHGEGRLVPETSPAYHIAAKYGKTAQGELRQSPSGSVIAAICSADGLVMGMMPHPERRIDPLRGGCQGLAIFQAGAAAVR